MDFFMSGEIDGQYNDFEEAFRNVRKDVNGKIKEFIKDKDYGTEIIDLGIIPIIIKFNDKMEKEGWFKERVLFKKTEKSADIRLRIDYNKFVKGDNNKKKLLLIDNVIKSIRAISTKAKKDFKAKELEDDILKLFNLTVQDLEAL